MPKKQILTPSMLPFICKQTNIWFIVEAKHDYLLLVRQDCEVFRFLSVFCAYENSIDSRYPDEECDQSDITSIDSTYEIMQ